MVTATTGRGRLSAGWRVLVPCRGRATDETGAEPPVRVLSRRCEVASTPVGVEATSMVEQISR
jgi:hypothetical protein